MAGARQCGACGALIPDDAPRGLCPKCLLRKTAELLSSASPHPASADAVEEWTSPIAALLAEHLPQYEILGPLGSGGMAVVYRVRQRELGREVALKILKPGTVTPETVRRFHHEAEALGRLQHPGIARIYDFDTVETELGVQPYFALELIGEPDTERALDLTVYADEQQLHTRERMALLAKVAEAVHYAHQKGIIHRDLKPGNILVDASGQPKILDFGVARLTDQDVKATTMHTGMGQLIGTLAYMSPEQAGGDPAELDTRSDVYALGVIGYQLLCGRLPYNLRERQILEAVRVIREEDPERLSSIDRTLRGDIETILLKSLAKEKDRRYQSAAQFATDIHRYLRDEPVEARQPSTWYQLKKFARRNRAVVTAIATVFCVLVLGIAATTWQAMRAVREAARAKAAEDAAGEEAARATLAAEEARRHLYGADMLLAYRHLKQGAHQHGAALVEAHRPREDEPDYRGWEWYYLQSLLHHDLRSFSAGDVPVPRAVWSFSASGVPVPGVVWDPTETRVAAASGDGIVRIWDPHTGVVLKRLEGHRGPVQALGWDSRTGLLATGGADHSVRVWNPADPGDERARFDHTSRVLAVAWSPDGQRLASGGEDGTARIWDVARGTGTHVLESGLSSVHAVAWSHSGDVLVTGHGVEYDPDSVGHLLFWNSHTGEVLGRNRLDSGVVRSLAVRPETDEVLVGQDYSTFRLWNISSNLPVFRSTEASGRTVFCVAWSPDGTRFATAGNSRVIRIWNPDQPALKNTLSGHASSIISIAWSPDGRRLISGDAGGVIRVWDPDTSGDHIRVCTFSNSVSTVRWAPDSRRLAVADWLNDFQVWDAVEGKPLMVYTGHENRVFCAAWNPRGDRLASVGHDKTVRIWNAATGEAITTLRGHSSSTVRATWSPDGRRVASLGRVDPPGANNGKVIVWDLATGEATLSFGSTSHGGHDEDMDWSSSNLLAVPAVAEERRLVRIWDVDPGREEHPFVVPGYIDGGGRPVGQGAYAGAPLAVPVGSVTAVAWSRDGSRLAVGTEWDCCGVWDTATRKMLWMKQAHAGSIYTVAWSPDGKRLVTVGYDRWVKLHAAATGEEVFSFRAGLLPLMAAAWSPDGCRLAVGGRDCEVRIWDASRGYALEKEPRLQSGTTADRMRAMEYARAGAWSRAAAEYGKVMDTSQADSRAFQFAAILMLQAGDTHAYQGLCRAMLERFGDSVDGLDVEHTAKVCSLALQPVGDTDRLKRMAEAAVEAMGTGYWSPHHSRTLAMVHLRRQEYAQALRSIARSDRLNLQNGQLNLANVEVCNRALESMCHLGRGDRARAAKSLAAVTPIFRRRFDDLDALFREAYWHDWLVARYLYDQAGRLIEAHDRGEVELSPGSRSEAVGPVF